MKKEKSLLRVGNFIIILLIVSCSTDNMNEDVVVIDDGTGNGTYEIIESSEVIKDTMETISENSISHEAAEDYIYEESEIIEITLSGNTISSSGVGVTIDESIATITTAAIYRITGNLTDGRLIVDTEDETTVKLILNGVNITSGSNSPLSVMSAEKTIIILADNTDNYLTDATSYVYEGDDDEPDAALFSKDDLTIYGAGSLTVNGNYNEAIKSKDGLLLKETNITVTSVDDGIQGKDYLIINGGQYDITVDGDGLKSNNDDDSDLGYIFIEDGDFDIASGDDGIQAETDIVITGGNFTIVSGGGSSASLGSDDSAKGIKAGTMVSIDQNPTFEINSADDGIHSNGSIGINGGVFSIDSGDDGIHSDVALLINGGDITITKSYEGIESADITINDGNIHIKASDDGLNVAGGADGSGMGGSFSAGNYYLFINGGTIVIDAEGDGIDVNGTIQMTDGSVIVNGPSQSMNGAFDYDRTFYMGGGFMVAVGVSRMAQAASSISTQNSVLVNFNSTQPSGQMINVQTSDGSTIFSFTPSKSYESVVFSSPDLQKEIAYDLYLGGSSTGENTDGLILNGTYSPGAKSNSFTISNSVTTIN